MWTTLLDQIFAGLAEFFTGGFIEMITNLIASLFGGLG